MHAGQRVGNYYTKLYRGAADVAERVLSRLAENRQSILEWQRLCFDNSLPEWLQDALLNSVATMAKTGMWIEDGRWRQWESFSCSALEPVHIHFYRSLPYMLFFPQLSQSQFRGFASIQKPDGFINEDLGNSGRPIDNSQARDMGDCTSTFILGVYNHYLWTADRRFLDELWPAARKAAQWQIGRSRSFGLPARLNNTYDWWAFQDKDVVAYNAVLHLAALEAADRLAEIKGDADFARHCRQSIASGQKNSMSCSGPATTTAVGGWPKATRPTRCTPIHSTVSSGPRCWDSAGWWNRTGHGGTCTPRCSSTAAPSA